MSRFQGLAYPDAVVVLDTRTGELMRIPLDGSDPVLLRSGVVAADQADGRAGPVQASAETSPGLRALPESATGIDREVVTTYPYPIARTWLAFLETADPHVRCRLLVDSFTCLLKLWALGVASEYLASDVKDPLINQTLKRDFARPLLSAWNLMLQRGLPVLDEAGVEPFCPELRSAYDALEARCRDPIVIEVRYEDADGNERTRRSKLGKIQALIRYRNGLAHGYTQPAERVERELEIYVPVFRGLLEEARFMSRYPLCYAAPRRRDAPEVAYRLAGAWPASSTLPVPEAMRRARERFFFYDEARGRALPLGVFMDMFAGDTAAEAIDGTGRDVILFEGNTRSTLIYASLDGERVEKQRRAAAWQERVAAKEVEQAVLGSDGITIEALRVASSMQLDAAMQPLIDSAKYIPEATVPRAAIDKTLDTFEHGDYRALVLSGGGGTGKTTILADHARRRHEAGDVVLFYRASTLNGIDLSDRVIRDFGIRGMFFEDFLAAADAAFGDARLRVVVDAVNEHPTDAPGLVRAIDDLVRQAESYPWLRVVASIRDVGYERMPPNARFGRGPGTRYFAPPRAEGEQERDSVLIDVPPFELDELALVYERYRELRRPDPADPASVGVYLWRPRSEFSELRREGSTCAMMRNPLMTRLILSAFHRRPLPSELSFDEAMQLYVDQVVVEQDNPEGSYRDRRRLLEILIRQLDGLGAEAIDRERLYGIERLKAWVQNPQKDSPYVQLLDLGILIEEWDGDDCFVRFAFDGLFVYFLARWHESQINTADDLVRQLHRASSFPHLHRSLVVVVRRLYTQGGGDLVNDVLARTADGHPSKLTAEVVREALATLAQAHDGAFGRALAGLVTVPAKVAVGLLLDLFDRLFFLGEADAARRVIMLAVAEAERSGAAELHAAALLRRGRELARTGEVDAALDCLDRARALAEGAADRTLILRAEMASALILLERGESAAADETFAQCLPGLLEEGALREAADALRGQAICAGARGDHPALMLMTQEALSASESAGDLVGSAKALNNLGYAQIQRGDLAAAAETLQRALSRKEIIGDRASIAATLCNLGDLYGGPLDDRARAEAALGRALDMYQDIGHQRGVAIASTNLAVAYYRQRRFDEARQAIGRAVEIFRARGERGTLAYALWFAGSLALEDGGDLELAQKALIELNEFSGDGKIAAQAASIELRLAVRADDEHRIRHGLSNLDSALEDQDATGWDVMEGPASALLEAAAWMDEGGHQDMASDLRNRAVLMVGGRPYYRDLHDYRAA